MISTNLTFLRKSKRLSLEDVADAIHVSRQAVSKWESGETTPDLINAIALAKVDAEDIEGNSFMGGNIDVSNQDK